MINIILALVIGYAVGHSFGYHYAHQVVATECKRLGAFFVGNTTFKCIEIKEEEK